jgi:hypothetical protein
MRACVAASTDKDRGRPLVRYALARYVSPMGIYSDLMMVWPTLLYPFLFPWASGLLGVVFIAGGVRLRRRLRTSLSPETPTNAGPLG